MKYTFLIFFSTITFSLSASTLIDNKYGQDSISCVTNLSLYREYIKQKNYKDAINPWRKAFQNCPQSTKNIYIDGAKIFNYLIDQNEGNLELQKAYLDSLETLYDQRITYFGKREYVLGLKGSDMAKYDFADMDLAFEILQESVEGLKQKSKATPLFSYFKVATEKYKQQSFTTEQVLEVYAAVSDYLDYNLANDSKSQKYYVQASENVEKLFVPFATCPDLISMFDAKYQENPDDLNLVKRIVKVLDKKDCTDANVYFEAATKLHLSEPSALSAYNMGNLSLRKNKSSEAIAFYKQALELSEQDADKANYYYGLSGAYFKEGNNSAARSFAYKALEISPNWGKPLVLIGDIYAASSSQCGTNSFESAMLFSAAIDKFIAAKKFRQFRYRIS
jgi:tetratricopeptide (TPR) repeat protein